MKNGIRILKMIALLVIFQSCNTSSKEEQVVEKEEIRSFMEIISVIPDIKLPYIMRCGIEGQYPDADELGSDIVKMFPEISVIVGKLPIKNDKVYILYGVVGDIISPHLNIYDRNGNKINSLYLHISHCGFGYDENEEMEFYMNSVTTINKDFSIHMSDTTVFHYDVEDSPNYGKDTTIVKTREMNLTQDGYYKITKETRRQIKP